MKHKIFLKRMLIGLLCLLLIGAPKEILIPGETTTVIIISLSNRKYFQVITASSKTPVGIIRAVFSKVKKPIEEELSKFAL